jgi:hypothetical protein
MPVPGDAPRFESGEWRWALLVAALATLATTVPYLLAWARTPPGHVWIGTTHNEAGRGRRLRPRPRGRVGDARP